MNCVTQNESANEGWKLLPRTDKLSPRQLTMWHSYWHIKNKMVSHYFTQTKIIPWKFYWKCKVLSFLYSHKVLVWHFANFVSEFLLSCSWMSWELSSQQRAGYIPENLNPTSPSGNMRVRVVKIVNTINSQGSPQFAKAESPFIFWAVKIPNEHTRGPCSFPGIIFPISHCWFS